jgi:hypothetical protein
MPDVPSTHRPPGRARRTAFTAVAALATLLTLLLTVATVAGLFGAEASDGDRLATVAHLPWLALGWCAGFAAMLRGAARRPAAMQQAVAMLLGLYLTGMVLTGEDDPVFYVGFGVVVVALVLLHPARGEVFRPGAAGVSPWLLVLSLLGAGPLFVYAAALGGLARTAGADGPFYTGVAAAAVAVPLVGVVASLRAPGFRLAGWSAAAMLAGLGLGSLLYPAPGALGGPESALALLGAAALAAATAAPTMGTVGEPAVG